jgi:hypothetical protein
MTITIDAEVEESEIVSVLIHNTELIEEAVATLAARAKPASAEQAMWVGVSRALGMNVDDLERMEPDVWAEAFRLMDRIDRDAALDALRRTCPGEIP